MKNTSTNLLPLLGMYYAERERAEREGDYQRALAITHQIERWEGEPYAADLRFSNVASLNNERKKHMPDLHNVSLPSGIDRVAFGRLITKYFGNAPTVYADLIMAVATIGGGTAGTDAWVTLYWYLNFMDKELNLPAVNTAGVRAA